MSRTWSYVLGYVLWVVSAALVVLDMLVSRGLFMRILTLTNANRWVLGAIDRFGFLFLGLIGLAFVIFFEHYYREGIERNVLWRRFGLITAAELSLLFLAGLVSFLIP
jgi:hypothetical protein